MSTGVWVITVNSAGKSLMSREENGYIKSKNHHTV